MKDQTRIRLFFLAMMLFSLGANFAHPITPTVIKNLGLHDYMFGVAYAAMAATNFLASPFWGKINVYLSSRKTMLIGGIGYGIGQILFGLAQTEGMIVLARLVSGAFASAVFVSFLTYIVNTSGEEVRGTHLITSATIQSVFSAFGYLIGGLLGEISIALTFGVQALTLITCGFLFLMICKDDTQKSLKETTPGRLIKEANPFVVFLASREFMTVLLASLFAVNALANIGFTAYEQCFNYYIKDQFGLTSAYNGAIKAAVGFITLAANSTICVWIVRKTDSKKSLVLVLTAAAVSIISVIMAPNIGLFMVLNLLFYGFNAISIPVIQNLIAEDAEGEKSNVVMGFCNATKHLGGIIGALTAGFVYGFGPKISFIFAAASFLAATGCVIYYNVKCRKIPREKTETAVA